MGTMEVLASAHTNFNSRIICRLGPIAGAPQPPPAVYRTGGKSPAPAEAFNYKAPLSCFPPGECEWGFSHLWNDSRSAWQASFGRSGLIPNGCPIRLREAGPAPFYHSPEEGLLHLGATLLCAMGRAQEPPLFWHHDGFLPLGSLVDWVDFDVG